MLYLTAFGHGGCYNQSSVNLATRYRCCQLLPSRLCQSAQDDDERGDGPTVLLLCGVPMLKVGKHDGSIVLTDSVETVHTHLGVSLWLLMGWLKAVTVINGLEQNMLVFIYCVENFVNISVQIINTVSEYAGVLSRLFSTMADRAC